MDPIVIPEAHRPTSATTDLDHLAFNFHSIRNFVGEQVLMMAIVKADAYGHGAPACSLRLEHEGADWFGVATPDEGVEIRQAGVRAPILSFGSWPGEERRMAAARITPTVFQLDRIAAFDRVGAEIGEKIRVHIKIDTGMGRVGIRHTDAAEFAGELARYSNIEVEGLLTHFASADEPENPFTNRQIARFAEAVAAFHAKGLRPRFLDMANSPGAIVHPGSRSMMVRIGGLLYGLGGDVLPAGHEAPELRPVLSLTSRIGFLKHVSAGTPIGYGSTFTTERESLIATIPIGYHDGLPRLLSNVGKALVRGSFAPIVGRVSMDWTTIDVTDVARAAVGDLVTFIGDDGDSSIRAEDIAHCAGTISYEITCGVSQRVHRVYNGGNHLPRNEIE